MKKLLLSLGMGLFAWWSAVGQTTLNTTVGSTGYSGTNSSGTNSYITFLVENNSGGGIFLTDVGNWTSSTDNGVTVTLLASTTNLSGAPGTVTPPGTIPAGWTTVATNVVSGISSATLGVNNVITNQTYLIPSGTSVRFLLHTTGTNRYSGTGAGTCTPNTFTSAGVSLKVGDVQIGGLNVGYGGPNNPRFFTGSITFAPAGPCTSPPFVGSATTSNATPCAGQTFGLSLDTATFGTGQTYQWEISTDNVNWTAISGATGASLNTSQIASSYYRVQVTCSTTVASGSVFVYTGPATTPLFENFTGATGSSSNPAAPGCWSYWEPSGHLGWGYTISSTLSKSLPNRWYFYNSSNVTDYIYLVSPQIQGLDSGTKQISFWQTSGTTSYNSSIVVGTVADPANPSATFSPIDTLSAGSAWTEFIVLLDSANGYNGTHQFIAFAYKDATTLRALYLDDIAIEDIPPCPKPTALNALNITGTTALLDWEGVGGTYSVQWGPCGFNTATGGSFISNIAGTSTSLTGLAGNTCYEFYVRADCGVNGLSAWNGPFAFTTAIIPAWLENFTVGYSPTATVPVPARWSEQYGFAANPSTFTSTSSAWNVDGFGNVGTTGAVRLSFFNTSTTVRDWTVTPPIDLSNGPWQFYFDLAVTTSGGTGTATMGNDDTVMVIVSTDNGATWNRSNAVAKFHAGSGLSNVGSTYTADLSAFSGQTVRIAIFGESTVSNSPLPTYDFHMDNVGVRVPPTCPAPTSGVVTNVTTTTVDLSWSAGLGNLSYTIEWGPCGFLQGTGSTTNVAFTGTTAQVSGLTPATCYDFYIQGNCGPGNGQSAWIGPFTATTLCLPILAPVVENFDGPSWVVGTGTNNAGSQLNLCWDRNSESVTTDFTWGPRAIVTGLGTTTGPSGDHTTGTTNFLYTESTVGASPGVATLWSQQINTSTLTNPEMRFWYHMYGSGIGKLVVSLDTNNGGFFKVDSLVGQKQTSKADAWKEMIVSLIPYAGKNIQVRWQAFKTNTIGDFAIDDFSVISGPTCPQPTQLSAGNLTGFTADLDWVSSGTSFKIEYGPQGFLPGAGTVVSGVANNNYTLTGLTPITCYDYYVRSICSASDSSLLSGPFNFCTPCAPFTAPFSQNFDGLAINAGAPCLGVAFTGTPSTLPYQQVRTNQFNITPQSSPNVLQLYSGNNAGIDVVWVSPEFSDLDSNNRWVKFGSVTNLAAASTTPVRMAVGTMSNPSDPSTWVSAGDTVVMNTQYGWVNSIVPLTSVPSGHKYIGLKYVSTTTFVSIFIDNFVYEKIPSCPEPTGLNVNPIASTSATVSWTSNSTGTSWQLSYAPTPFAAPASGTTVVSAVTTYNLTGLQPSTQYGVYVREICSALDTSNWSLISVFNTSCPVAFNAPYFTDFSPVGIQQTGSLPNCWNALPGPTSASFTWRGEEGTGANKNSLNTGPLWDNTQFGTAGGKYIYLETSSGTANDTARLISPIIVVSGLTTPMLSFYYHMHGATMGNLYTLVRTKGGPWIAIDTIAGQQQLVQADPWLNRSLVLPSTLGDSIQIKFLGSRGTSFTGDMSLDDISVIQAPTCPAPNSLNSSGITSNAANLNWTSNATGTSWQVSYGVALASAQAGTKVIASAKPFNLAGLTPATQYCYYVREICGPGDTSAWSPSHCFTTACVPYSMPFVEDFQAWAVGNDAPLCFSSAGGLQKWDRFVTGSNIVARANFWSFNAPNDFKLTSPQIIVSSAAQLQYKWSHLYSSTYPDDALYILGRTVGSTGWDTLVAQKGPTFNSNDGAANTTPGSFIWDTVALDPTWVGQNIEIQLHGVSDFGPSVFIDSLSVVPVGGVSCPAPTALASANIVCDAFDVSFSSASGTSYAEYGPAGFTPGSGTVVSPAASPLSISGLTAGTNYEVYVYDVCTGDTSLPAGPLAVSTASSPKPTASFVWTVTPTLTNATAAFDASGSTGGTTYSWDFGNSSTGTGVNANGTYTANGTYNVTLIVSNACGSDTLTQAVTVNGIGVVEAALAASFQAYPNPTRGKVALSFSLMYSNAATIEIMDLSGRVVWVESAEVNGTYHKELDLSSYAAGVYLVRVSSEDGVVARRLIVE